MPSRPTSVKTRLYFTPSFLGVPHINLPLDLYCLPFLEPFHPYALFFLSPSLSLSSLPFFFIQNFKTCIAFYSVRSLEIIFELLWWALATSEVAFCLLVCYSP